MFVRYSLSDEANQVFNSFQNAASSSGGDGPTYTLTQSLSIDNNYVVSPSFLVNVRYGLNRRHVDRLPISAGFTLASLGFPANVIQTAQAAEFPRVDVQSFHPASAIIHLIVIVYHETEFLMMAMSILLVTSQFVDALLEIPPYFTQFFPSGDTGSENAQWMQPDTDAEELDRRVRPCLDAPRHSELRADEPQPIAGVGELVLGVVHPGRLEAVAPADREHRPPARVRRPGTERFNRLSYFDQNATSPIANLVSSNAFFNPADLRGALVFMNENDRRQVDTDLNNFGPRVGVAYNPSPKIVVRSAYGVYYMPSHVQAAGHSGSAGMMGFNSQSNMIVSLDGRLPLYDDGQPVPRRVQPAARRHAGRGDVRGAEHRRRQRRRVHDECHALRSAVELQRAARAAGQLRRRDSLPREQGDEPAHRRERPGVLAGDLPTCRSGPRSRIRCRTPSSASSPTPRRPCASRRSSAPAFCGAEVPQYDGVSAFRVPGASSIYHAMTLRVDKRFSGGLSLLTAYTWGKLIDDASTAAGRVPGAGGDAAERVRSRVGPIH